ncbi:hypothetical protein GCM10009117_09950 [Gangjinia marincola]|uniref:Secretion system C-terminal sorting domain-containing protein n=1 Tax=Gangjinia marincola TaxID=578463 RepID=A0ABN1MFL1_9FLAO
MKNTISFLLLVLLVTFATAQGEWKQLKTGAGGWITGMDIHPSGSPLYARSDVAGAFRYNEDSQDWTQVVTAFSMPSSEIDVQKYGGVLSIVSAPGNPNIAYMAFEEAVFRSTNQGTTWEKTNLPAIDLNANDDTSKLSGERLAVDPLDANVVYLGSINDGLFYTQDGGDNWELVAAVPFGITERGVREVKFDPSGGSTNGKTSIIYVSVDGEGVYKSVDAGVSWANINVPASNPIILDTELTPSGKLYIVGEDASGTSFGVLEYDGNAWRSVYAEDDRTLLNIAIDPFNENRALVFSEGFEDTYQTENLLEATPAWQFKSTVRAADNIPWMAWSDGNWFTIGEVFFDPVNQDQLWISQGIGTWKTSDLFDDQITWVEESKGQEHLVANDVVGLPTGEAVTASWDRPLFFHDDLDEYPATYQPINRFNSSWSIDQSIQDPNFLVAIVDDHRNCCFDAGTRGSGYSEDGGQTWTEFTTQPGGDTKQFGVIAVSADNSDNIVWLPTFNQLPYYTTNRGETWQQASIPGESGNCCHSNFFFERDALAADRVAENTFYLYDFGNGAIHRTTNGGANWETLSGLDSPFAYNVKLLSVPGHEGHLFWANGIEQGVNLIEGLKRSVDGGETWTDIPNTDKVLNVAVGAAEAGANYPTIFIQGEVNGNYGIYKSADEGATWTQIGDYPLGIYEAASAFEGNPFIPGVLYVGLGGSGFAYYEDQNLLTAPESSSTLIPSETIEIYPNPVKNILEVSGIDQAKYTIHSLSGRSVQAGSLANNQPIEVGNLTSGIYFITMTTTTDEVTLKFIKE